MKSAVFSTLVLSLFLTTSCQPKKDLEKGIYADIQTDKGDIWVELAYQKAPMTVANFIGLAEGTLIDTGKYAAKRFYDGIAFHRVVPGFVIQAGDPTGTGSGGPGYRFPNEISDSLKHDRKGTVAMANSGPNTNGSQFYITLRPTPNLDGHYSVFGYVSDTLSQKVVDSIQAKDTIKTIQIIRVGRSAKAFDAKKVFAEKMAAHKKERVAYEREAEKKRAFFTDELFKKVKTFDSGLKMLWLQRAKAGEKPEIGTEVGVQYAGYLSNGQLFDSSDEAVAKKNGKFDPTRPYGPVSMTYSKNARLIPGFREALLKMNYGDRAWAVIPPDLGYGERGAGTVIPPNSTLCFRIEVEKLGKQAE